MSYSSYPSPQTFDGSSYGDAPSRTSLYTIFVPTFGISRPWAMRSVKQIWGPDAAARPFQYRKIEGLLLETTVIPTKEQLEDLKNSSWHFEMDAARRRAAPNDDDHWINKPVMLNRR